MTCSGWVGEAMAQYPSSPRGSVIGSMTFKAKVRDFREYNSTDGRLATHPDFNTYRGTCRGNVDKRIDTAGISSSFPMDNRNPKLVRSRAGCFTSVGHFDDWYNDKDSSVNRPFQIDMVFTMFDNCLLVYDNTSFFPIDKGKAFVSLSDPPLEPFGHIQPGHPYHNFGFTMEFHASFTYVKGAGQIFSFRGDDDVWVFINDSLVIDLGGVHGPQSMTVNLDQFPPGFLEDGKDYIFDFFSAERHVTGSNIQITTSMHFLPEDGPDLLRKGTAASAEKSCLESPNVLSVGRKKEKGRKPRRFSLFSVDGKIQETKRWIYFNY